MALRLSNVMKRGSGFPVAEIKNVLQCSNVHVLLYKLVCRVANCLISLIFFNAVAVVSCFQAKISHKNVGSRKVKPDPTRPDPTRPDDPIKKTRPDENLILNPGLSVFTFVFLCSTDGQSEYLT